MKSFGRLFETIAERANLRAAMLRAAHGKGERRSVARFVAAADSELERLRQEVLGGTYRPRAFVQFRIVDPKPRLISCADFRDRVLQHAVCGIIAPCMERRFIADSFACRVGKGVHRAVGRACVFTRGYRYCLKADVAKFYDSVNHERLRGILHAMFREERLRRLLDVIIAHRLPGAAPGKGLPIGNLTSQWFANLYLDRLDHHVKERMHVAPYVRYMDDFCLWADDKSRLWDARSELAGVLERELDLRLNAARTRILPCSEGVPFLGLRLFPRLLRVQGRRVRRARRILRARERAFALGEISAEALVASARSLAGPRRFFGLVECPHGELDL